MALSLNLVHDGSCLGTAGVHAMPGALGSIPVYFLVRGCVMRFVALVLFRCAAASAQYLTILPPSVDATGQNVFFGSSSFSPDRMQRPLDIYARDSSGVRLLTHISGGVNSTGFGFTISPDG